MEQTENRKELLVSEASLLSPGTVFHIETGVRPGLYLIPQQWMVEVPVTRNNRAVLVSSAQVKSWLVKGSQTGFFIPLPVWWGMVAQHFVPDLFSPQQQDFDELFRINVKSVWLGMRFAKPIIAERGGGAIINTASAAGLTATPTLMGYGASKHAVVGMTKTAAVEMAPMGIRVNCICPGIVSTQMIQTIENKSVSLGLVSSADQYQQAYSDRTPLKRYVEASEVAALAAFLGSDEAGMITGETSVIDGGFLQS